MCYQNYSLVLLYALVLYYTIIYNLFVDESGKFSNVEILNSDFIENLFRHCITLKPFLDYLNELFYES